MCDDNEICNSTLVTTYDRYNTGKCLLVDIMEVLISYTEKILLAALGILPQTMTAVELLSVAGPILLDSTYLPTDSGDAECLEDFIIIIIRIVHEVHNKKLANMTCT